MTRSAGRQPAALGRDAGPFSARNASKGALLAEAHAVFRLLASGASLAEVKAACLSGRILRQRARETRRQIWNALHHRHFAWQPPGWVMSDLLRAARGRAADELFVGLVYIHYARRDRLTFEFVTDRLFPLLEAKITPVTRDEVLDFLAEREDREPQVRRWRETTRKKLARNILSALRDFGVFEGIRRKKIRRLVVRPEVALHLWRLLHAEGLRGRALIEARDWRLFLWDVEDVRLAVSGLDPEARGFEP